MIHLTNHHFPFPWQLSESAIAETPRKPRMLPHNDPVAVNRWHLSVATRRRQTMKCFSITLRRSIQPASQPRFHRVQPGRRPNQPCTRCMKNQHFRSRSCKLQGHLKLPRRPNFLQNMCKPATTTFERNVKKRTVGSVTWVIPTSQLQRSTFSSTQHVVTVKLIE